MSAELMQVENRPSSLTLTYFSPWGGTLMDAATYLAGTSGRDLSGEVSEPSNRELMRMARLDCDWDAECIRCFTMAPGVDRCQVTGIAGLKDLVEGGKEKGGESWLVFIGQRMGLLGESGPALLKLLSARGLRIAFWAFDEASRSMNFFREMAPFVSVLIHDEHPLEPDIEAALPADSICIHRSWLANVVPFSVPFQEQVEPRIVFLGSKLGLTEARKRQLSVLKEAFEGQVVAWHDYDVSLKGREQFSGYQVHFCPEGRKFVTPSMNQTHTDRAFWSGCFGQVPVIEDSRWGGRLEELAQKELLLRFPYGDDSGMIEACREALRKDVEYRKKVYHHYNAHETIGGALIHGINQFRGQKRRIC
jgi:hypothetical protein